MVAFLLLAVALLPPAWGATWTASHFSELVARDSHPAVDSVDASVFDQAIDQLPHDRKIAVSDRERHEQYDDIEALLEKMGSGFPSERVSLFDLARTSNLAAYDILFLGCAAEMAPEIPTHPSMAPFSGISIFQKMGYSDGVRSSLRDFVDRGGAIYASDWAAQYLRISFPESITISPQLFPKQYVQARVLDPGLAEVIGQKIGLVFDKDLWVCAERVQGGKVYLEGLVKDASGKEAVLPLLVGFPHGKGQVVYTSFHNETAKDRSAELTEQQKGLLEYLVFKQVTSGVSGEVSRILVEQKYTLSKETLFSTGTGGPRTFTFQTQPGKKISFMLGWNVPPTGPRPILELAVQSPTEETLVKKSDKPPVVVSVESSVAGDYRYAVHSVQVPYNNFPFVLQVGVKE